MATETALIPAARLTELKAIERLRRETAVAVAEAEADGEDVIKALVIARATNELRKMLTPQIMQDVMQLAGSQLGFGWDKEYGVETVRDCAITATLSGFRLANPGGGEWYIMSGRFYGGLQGYKRIVESWPGMADLRIDLGVPVSSGGGALVPATATWRIGDKRYELSCVQGDKFDGRIPVRVNSGMGADAIHGKAKRKLYARILDRLTGMGQQSDAESDFDDDAAITAEVVAVKVTPAKAPHAATVAEILATFRETLAACEQKTDCLGIRDYTIGRLAEVGIAGDSDEVLTVESETEQRIEQIAESRGK